jgi:(p)ppGpp synthase/HD superfamily hydrolase
MQLLNFARYYATVEHVMKRQHTHGMLPYTHHLQAVELVLRSYGITEEVYLVAAWLHDVREDCGIKDKTIREMFGSAVADLVGAVTDEPGNNRKQRKALTYPKIRKESGAVIIKLADRLANTGGGGDLLNMYRDEHPDFRHALRESAVPDQYVKTVERMWKALDNALLAQ